LSRFSDHFVNCVDEHSVSEGRIVVRTTATIKDEVRQWLGEFAAVVVVSYVVDKVYKEGFRRGICLSSF